MMDIVKINVIRYESERFYDQTIEPDNGALCGSVSENATGFRVVGQQALMDASKLQHPKSKVFMQLLRHKWHLVVGAIYAVAQCVETTTETDCLKCMQVGYNNLHTCPPNTEGRAYDAGYFMRYSTTPYFADYQTIDIAPYFKQGTITIIPPFR